MSAELDLLRRAWRARRDDTLRHDVADRRPIVVTAGVVAHHALELLAATDAQVALALSHDPHCACAACDDVAPIVERLVLEAECAIAEGALP